MAIGGDRGFGITSDNLRGADTSDLFAAGRVLGGERVAAASVRVMGAAFATGHAAGVSAALLAGSPIDLAARTRYHLEQQNAILKHDTRRSSAPRSPPPGSTTSSTTTTATGSRRPVWFNDGAVASIVLSSKGKPDVTAHISESTFVLAGPELTGSDLTGPSRITARDASGMVLGELPLATLR